MTEVPPKTLDGRAEFYRVNERTIRRWGERAAPLHSVPEMAKWMVKQNKLPRGFVVRMRELGANTDGVIIEEPGEALRQFKESRKGKKNPGEEIDELEYFRDYYAKTLEDAIGGNDQDGIKFYTELLLDVSNSIRQQKLAADKLGIEEGQLFTKEQLARIFRAWTFWAMRAIDADLADLCPKLVGLPSVDGARRVLEPVLLSARFVKPFAKAARIESESSLSPWMVEAIRESVDDFIEDGRKEFDQASL